MPRPRREQPTLIRDKNQLYYGDNLVVLNRHFADESVDLIYLDPPFASGQNYNLLFKMRDGRRSAAQEKAFEDTWHWNTTAIQSYQDAVRNSPAAVSEALQAFQKLVPASDMLAYLAMMAPRLVELHRVLRPTGSIYLHCDPTASHYLKLLMDAVFGPSCFRNEIIWSYRRWPSPAKHFQRMHDVLLFYAARPDGPETFNVQYEANSPSYDKRFGGKTQVLDPETKTRKITGTAKSKGLPRRDVWDLSIIAGFKKERVGYPTQKPETLLTRIIEVSTNEGDTVFDPFCGCGTTVAVAHGLKRRWVGIDIEKVAIDVIGERLRRDYPDEDIDEKYEVLPEPASVENALALAGEDKYEFQWWVLRQLGAAPAPRKKGADRGIDGRIYFFDTLGSDDAKQVIVSVKGGKSAVLDHVRVLAQVVDRERAAMGLLVMVPEPTKAMRAEAAEFGEFYSEALQKMVPRLQFLSVADLIEGKSFEHPGYWIPPATVQEDAPAMLVPPRAMVREPVQAEDYKRALTE
jgi:DNA modification methylase